MKKFLIVLSILLLAVIGYLVYTLNQVNNKLLATENSDYESIISQLENELSIKSEELSALQAENQQLKTELSGTAESNNSLSDDTTNTSDNDGSSTNTTTINSTEAGFITQVYTDGNGNRKIEIDYIQIVEGSKCGAPELPNCIINENTKLRTFTVSNDVKINTLSIKGYIEDVQISFDYFKEKFNDTNNYGEYPYNYSDYFKQTPFQITIENNIVVKIEEIYRS